MKKLFVIMLVCLVWVIYLRNGEIIRAKELCTGPWTSGRILTFIDMQDNKIFIPWEDVAKVQEEK